MNRQGCHIYYHKVNTTFVQGSICVPLQTKLISVQLPGLSSCHSKRFSLSTDEAVIDSPCPSLKKLPWFWIGPSSCLKRLPRLFNPNKTHQMGTVFSNLVCIWNWNLRVKGFVPATSSPSLLFTLTPRMRWQFIHLRNKPCASLDSSGFFPLVFIVSLLRIMNWSRVLSVWFIWLLMMWSTSGPLGLLCCCFNKHISRWWGHWHTFCAFMVQWS